jgi:hypothetical protein
MRHAQESLVPGFNGNSQSLIKSAPLFSLWQQIAWSRPCPSQSL